jgi:pentatricopeptide repeat protein
MIPSSSSAVGMEVTSSPKTESVSDNAADPFNSRLMFSLFDPELPLYTDPTSELQAERQHLRSLPIEEADFFAQFPKYSEATYREVLSLQGAHDRLLPRLEAAEQEKTLDPRDVDLGLLSLARSQKQKNPTPVTTADIDRVKALWDAHPEMQFRMSTHSAYLAALCANGWLPLAQQHLGEVIARVGSDVAIPPAVYTPLLFALAKGPEPERAIHLYEALSRLPSTLNDGLVYAAVILAMGRASQIDQALGLARWAGNQAIALPPLLYNALLLAAARRRDTAVACVDIEDNMRGIGVPFDGVTYVALLKACSATGNTARAEALYHRMQYEDGIQPNAHHLSTLLHVWASRGREISLRDPAHDGERAELVEKAKVLLESSQSVMRRSLVVRHAFLSVLLTAGSLSEAIEEAETFRSQWNARTLTLILSAAARRKECLARMPALWKAATGEGGRVQPDVQCYGAMIWATSVGSKGSVRRAGELLKECVLKHRALPREPFLRALKSRLLAEHQSGLLAELNGWCVPFGLSFTAKDSTNSIIKRKGRKPKRLGQVDLIGAAALKRRDYYLHLTKDS